MGGLVVAAIVIYFGRRELIADQWRHVIPGAGAALAYGTASALGGSGFIAAFVAGMTFRLALGRDPEHINELSEQVGNVLNGVTFLFFGAILLGPALGDLSWQLALYAVLSLTLAADAARSRSRCSARTPGRRRSPSWAGSVPAGWHRSCSP